MYKVCVLASGGGGNLKSIITRSIENLEYQVTTVVVDRSCGAIGIAELFNIPCVTLINNQVETYLRVIPEDTDLVVLAGFMPIVPLEICHIFEGKFINTHPSLLPKFGGIGMYGVKVQEAVLAAGETNTGCTVHRVVAEVDSGEILAQKSIEIPEGIDAWTLGGSVFMLENELLPEVISRFAKGEF